MLKPLITIEDWSGGASYNPSMGKKNGYFFGTGADHNSRMGYLSTLPNKENYGGPSGASTVGDYVYCGVRTDTDSNNYFGGSAGALYRQDADPSVTLEHTSTNNSNISNMVEYKGYLYYGQSTTVGRLNLTTSTYTDSWQTGLTSSTWKPMNISSDDSLYIGHGQYVAKWDDTTYTAQALDLKDEIVIKDIDNFGIQYMAIAGDSSNSNKNSAIFLWDRVASTWNDEIPVPEKNIYAVLTINGVLWFLAGTRNISLYALPIGSRSPIKLKEWRSEYTFNESPTAYPNAITYRDGRVFFAISGVYRNTSLTTPSGIFSVNADLNNLDFQGHYLNTSDTPSTQYYYYFIEDMAYSDVDTSLRWSEYISGPVVSKRLYREQNRIGVDISSSTATLHTFWYQAPVGTLFHFDGFGWDGYPLESSNAIQVAYYTDFSSSSSGTALSDSTSGSVGKYTPKVVTGIRSIKFVVTLSAFSNANTGVENIFIKRIFATGKLIPDNR